MSIAVDKLRDRQRGCFYGLAIGDALGAAVEFKKPGKFEPVTGYRDGGPWNLNPGEWTDDTAMALALADSLSRGFSAQDQLECYKNWYYTGKYSVNNKCFDCGNQTRESITEFARSGKLCANDSIKNSGNGSIMRLAPIPIKFYSDPLLETYARESSVTTHGSPLCTSACAYLATVIAGLIRGESKDTVLDNRWLTLDTILKLESQITAIANGSFKSGKVKGTGFVVESLEAAVWAFWQSNTFEEAVLSAVNLGDDADTTGAIAGQMAGALYGYSSIPQSLIDGLARKDLIDTYLNPILAGENK